MDILVLTPNLKSKGALAALTDLAALGSHARRRIQPESAAYRGIRPSRR
jgi:hypothetical protein